MAWLLVEELVENPDLYRVKVDKTSQGPVVIDAGIGAQGGFQVGRLITEICLGGLGKAEISYGKYDHLNFPSILVRTDHPAIATLGCQFAGWRLSEGDYSAIGSGPARALALKPKGLFEEIQYRDESDRAVLVLETERPPPVKLINRVVEGCKIQADKLALILTPTTSLAGATQVSGRIVETGLHKLKRLGLDPKTVLYAWGCAPIPPSHPKFARAMGRTNDAILYGGIAYYVVESDDEGKLRDIVDKAPSSASEAYGKPFFEIFKKADRDFYKIDSDLFAPAAVMVNNVRTGNTFRSGKVNTRMLRKSFGLFNQ